MSPVSRRDALWVFSEPIQISTIKTGFLRETASPVESVGERSGGVSRVWELTVVQRAGGAEGAEGWGVLTVTYLNGFSPVCVRMWLLSVVAPANARPQYPHLKGRSLECVTTWFLNSDGCEKDWEQWPHWYGLTGTTTGRWVFYTVKLTVKKVL